jgi:hypothetical protein
VALLIMGVAVHRGPDMGGIGGPECIWRRKLCANWLGLWHHRSPPVLATPNSQELEQLPLPDQTGLSARAINDSMINAVIMRNASDDSLISTYISHATKGSNPCPSSGELSERAVPECRGPPVSPEQAAPPSHR